MAQVIEIFFLAGGDRPARASTLLIANTIRLSIFSRRREIEVMKLVGATNWFVRGPFMLEGLICGLVGASLAVILLLCSARRSRCRGSSARVDADSDVHALAFGLDGADPPRRSACCSAPPARA